MGQTVPKMSGKSPSGMEVRGRPQARGEGGRCPPRHGRCEEGLLDNAGSLLSLIGWAGLEAGRLWGRWPRAIASGSGAAGLWVGAVLGVPTTSPHENPKRQVIATHLPVDSAMMGHLWREHKGCGVCPRGADCPQR